MNFLLICLQGQGHMIKYYGLRGQFMIMNKRSR